MAGYVKTVLKSNDFLPADFLRDNCPNQQISKSVVMANEVMWNTGSRGRIRAFFSSNARITLALLGVMAIGLFMNQPAAIIPLLLGVIASGLAETDDHWLGRLVAQTTTLLFFALIIGSVQFSHSNPAYLMLVLVAAAFLLTLFGTVGERYRTMASATVIMSLYAAMATQPHAEASPALTPSVLLLFGALWHGLISVVWVAVFPMLPVEQNLARLYDVLGAYLALKSRMFEPVRGIDLEQRRLQLALHNGRVVEALNTVKESLFSRMNSGRLQTWLVPALHQFFVAQDVHERTSSSHEHYERLADAFFHSDVLYRCERVLELLGKDCLSLSEAIRKNERWTRDMATERAVEDMEAAIAYVEETAPAADENAQRARRSLRALATNLGAMAQELNAVFQNETFRMPADSALQDSHPRTLRQFRERLLAQFTLRSPIMRYAIRLSVALTAGYALMVATGDANGFWILLTIVFVCQPYYGTTLARLAERISGTVLGLFVGWALMQLFPGGLAQSMFTVVAGVAFFMLRATRYTLATAAITTLVLLAFNQVGNGYGLIIPRLIDTLEGSLIAGVSVWLILPSWFSRRLPRLAAEALRAQSRYLSEIMAQYGAGGKQDNLVYRIARRDAHNADAALSGALTAALKEPARIQRNVEASKRFLVLSHTLLNYLSALGAHRIVHLEPLEEAAAAEVCIKEALDRIAQRLDSHQTTNELDLSTERKVLQALGASSNEAPDYHFVLRAQLSLALQLLPLLRASAGELAST